MAAVGFIGVFLIAGATWVSLHAVRSLFFTGSIFFVGLLMLVYLWVIWKGIANKNNDPTISTRDYLEHSIHKLSWRRKTLTTYKWVYAVLLWLGMMCYLIDSRSWHLSSQIAIPLLPQQYIFGMRLYLQKTKEKKQVDALDQLIGDMQLLKTKIAD